MRQKCELPCSCAAANVTNWMFFPLNAAELDFSSDCSLTQLILSPSVISPSLPSVRSPSSPHPSRGVQLLPGHAVAAGARRAVRRRGFLRRGLRERAGVGARRRALRRQPVLQAAAPGAQEQVGGWILARWQDGALTSCFWPT